MSAKYSGSMTLTDGRRVPLSKEDAESILASVERTRERRSALMPTSVSALGILLDARERLRELGWREAAYCPKDGSTFAVCEMGSTGMWLGSYHGEWPSGYINYADCARNPGGMFFKELDKLTDEEKALIEKCDKDVAAYTERLARSFGAFQD